MAEKAEAMKSVETQWTDSRGLSSPTIWNRQSPEMRDFAARVYEGHRLLQKLGRAPRELPHFVRVHLRRLEEEAKEAAEATEEEPSPMEEESPEMEATVTAPLSPDPLSPAPKAEANLGAGPTKRHRCGECGKGFRWASHLQVHLRVHSGEKPFRCTVCERSFNVKSDLTRHKRVHTGEKPFKCTVCERSFAHKHDLTRHNKLYCGKMPYKCNAPGCTKTYIRSNHFARHVRTHGDEKPRSKARAKK